MEISTAQKGIWFLLNMKLTVSQQGSLVGKKVNSLWTALGLSLPVGAVVWYISSTQC